MSVDDNANYVAKLERERMSRYGAHPNPNDPDHPGWEYSDWEPSDTPEQTDQEGEE